MPSTAYLHTIVLACLSRCIALIYYYDDKPWSTSKLYLVALSANLPAHCHSSYMDRSQSKLHLRTLHKVKIGRFKALIMCRRHCKQKTMNTHNISVRKAHEYKIYSFTYVEIDVHFLIT